LFIHPYVVDPNDENVMYYPGGRDLWRNTNLGAISNSNSSGTSTNWNSVSNIVPSGYEITTIAMPESPVNQVYFGASSTSSAPLVYKLDNAKTNSSPTDITPSSLPSGAYVHDIEVNPQDGTEVIFVLSNYGVTAIYHTSDGGSNWTAVEGNLDANPGPSIRNAEIVNTPAGTVYLVATSTGVYSTDALSGGSTTWVQEGSSTIGYTVTEYLESRDSDGKVLAATHGRGMYTGTLNVQSVPGDPSAPTALGLTTPQDDILVDWDASPEADVIRYRIYRGKGPNSLALFDSVSSSQTEFTDTNASFGSWFYRVTAVDVDLNESGFSDLISAFQQFKTVDTNWKLIGSPMVAQGNVGFPSGFSLFGFNGAYQSVQTTEPKKGFWIKATATDSMVFDGSAMISSTISVNQGWNLIGGIADTILTTDINDPGGVLSATPIFEYDGSSYQSASEIRPSDGYWIHADQQGQIELALTITQTTPEAPGTRNTFYVTPTADAHWDEIRFAANGIEQSMYVAGVSLNPREKQPYLLPPQAPAAGLDVRTTDGYSLATDDKTEIDLTASAYPVRATLLQQGASGSRYRLVGLNNGEEIYYDLEPGKSVEITKSYSQLFLEIVSKQSKTLVNELFPNYPNPFNPATTIKYQLSEQAEVRLEVYDILGRRVGVLVNELQLPGEYTVNFDGSRLSSGTYFIQLRAGDFLKNQKMTLIK
ncbi:MAG: T9SS type A sorting domain-containing protein, partial [Balneolaceae bacterium]|nr:T9SS type A sorting domain-containing protein [Balneolaceae bacterium]